MNRKEILLLLLMGIMVIIAPIIFTSNSICGISFLNTGEIGDTIGGITAPFTSLIGAFLVYLALKAQIKANEIIQNQFLISHATDITYKQLERFEVAVSQFKIKNDRGDTLQGLEAFIFLNPRPIAISYGNLHDLDESELKEVRRVNCEVMTKYLKY